MSGTSNAVCRTATKLGKESRELGGALLGSKLLAEVSGNEVYKSAKSASGKSYAEGSLWVIYSLGVDMAPVWDELERAISRATVR